MSQKSEDRVWVVHADHRQYLIHADKRDAEAKAFEIALEQSVDGDVTIDDDPRSSLTHFVFNPQSGTRGQVYVASEPLY